jgi:hypothetical protein
MRRIVGLFVLFVAMNQHMFMLHGAPPIVADLIEQTGVFAVVAFVLQPWIYIIVALLMLLPQDVHDFFFRYGLEGAPLHMVILPSIASTAIYETAWRLLPRIRRVGQLVSHVPRAIPLGLYLVALITYTGLSVYVATAKWQNQVEWDRNWENSQRDLTNR